MTYNPKEIPKVLKEAKLKTDGYKTSAFSFLLILWDGLNYIAPNLIDDKTEGYITRGLTFAISYGLIDKFWRNRKNIFDWCKSIVHRDKK